ncbi:signal peptidase II [Fastidiosibacter lacustris]|uniref:signal peptidase II n=1 Tax=Fastidiosibacter lacustris TaxID=2056695 RepID=UPI000E356F3D|nr:signal peptidase II [Fastidiosibacter lacustris]
MNLRNTQIRWLWLSIVVILIDLGTKYIASTTLTYAKPVKMLAFFNLTLLHNFGAAFSFLSNADTMWQLVLFSTIAIVVSIIILIWLIKLTKDKNIIACALALILGGALGNLYDRMIHGYVVDFLDFHINNYHWPAFNIADSAICIGAGILIVMSFKKSDRV